MSPANVEDRLRAIAAAVEREATALRPRVLEGAAADRLFGPPRHERDLRSLTRALSVPIWDLLDRGGKRWRPALLVLGYEAVTSAPGAPETGVLAAGAAIELLHNATLVADDIEDGSPLRRGRPSLPPATCSFARSCCRRRPSSCRGRWPSAPTRAGLLDHAATHARELGLPCVVGTRHATRVIPQGAMVVVDGAAGVVYLDG